MTDLFNKTSIFDYLNGASDGLKEGYKDGYNQALKDFEKCVIQQSDGMFIDMETIKSIKEQLNTKAEFAIGTQ